MLFFSQTKLLLSTHKLLGLHQECMKTLIYVIKQSYHFSDLLNRRTMLNEDL